jgi:hypothetical protein
MHVEIAGVDTNEVIEAESGVSIFTGSARTLLCKFEFIALGNGWIRAAACLVFGAPGTSAWRARARSLVCGRTENHRARVRLLVSGRMKRPRRRLRDSLEAKSMIRATLPPEQCLADEQGRSPGIESSRFLASYTHFQ